MGYKGKDREWNLSKSLERDKLIELDLSQG